MISVIYQRLDRWRWNNIVRQYFQIFYKGGNRKGPVSDSRQLWQLITECIAYSALKNRPRNLLTVRDYMIELHAKLPTQQHKKKQKNGTHGEYLLLERSHTILPHTSNDHEETQGAPRRKWTICGQDQCGTVLKNAYAVLRMFTDGGHGSVTSSRCLRSTYAWRCVWRQLKSLCRSLFTSQDDELLLRRNLLYTSIYLVAQK